MKTVLNNKSSDDAKFVEVRCQIDVCPYGKMGERCKLCEMKESEAKGTFRLPCNKKKGAVVEIVLPAA